MLPLNLPGADFDLSVLDNGLDAISKNHQPVETVKISGQK
jgi:hypothetical protein